MMYTQGHRRRGAVLTIVIVAIMVMLIVGTALVRMGWMQRRQMNVEERRTQAEWLAESGIERAWVKLQATHDYKGETWKIDSAELGGRGAAEVEISVWPAPGQVARLWVQARAKYPLDVTLNAQVSKNLMMDRPATSKPEKSS